MFKNKKKKAALAALAVLALGNAMSVSAEVDVNWKEYKGYVKKLEDLKTEPLEKKTLDAGTNRPIFVEEGAKLCSWINNYLGVRVTNKVYYDSSGARYMDYTKTIDVEHPSDHLHLLTTLTISTQILQFDSAYTDGLWSPDTF